MNSFTYARPTDVLDAVGELTNPSNGGPATTKAIAGGTNLIDLMKENVERPTRLIDINRLPLSTISELADGGLRLGALVSNADTAYHPLVEHRYPLLSQTILAGASAQLRNIKYHVPVFADIHELDVIFVDEIDTVVNPLGAKGLGEIGLVAMPAAIANAVYHATGKRVHDLPIQLDRLL